ncbi:MAG: RluA family pseudouridine synthase [Candidatus Lambdaproteobacteria bacterium]|nr:RluA family pseudouridine synthase [Candidatus Lambdaproteobacteria bacterium]
MAARRDDDLTAQVRIVYLDRDVVVVEKPAGLASVRHPAELERRGAGELPASLQQIVPALIKRREGARAPKGPPRPVRVVQRLDIGTSGVLVFARTRQAERELGTQFRLHTVERRYLALVLGELRGVRRIESRLVENRGDGLRGSVAGPAAGVPARRAVTHVRPLEHLRGCTLVECRLETGRTHQIRIHLAEAGHPLCGETVYNRPRHVSRHAPHHGPRHGPPGAEPGGAPRIMLHAGELGFRHPRSQAALRFTMPLPPDFEAFLARRREHGVGAEAATARTPAEQGMPGQSPRAARAQRGAAGARPAAPRRPRKRGR